MTATDPRAAMAVMTPKDTSLSGPDSLNGHPADDAQTSLAVEGQDSPQAIVQPAPMAASPAGNTDPRTAKVLAAPTDAALSGSSTLNGHLTRGTRELTAVEGQGSPQAMTQTTPTLRSPAGSTTALPAMTGTSPRPRSLEGRETSRSHQDNGTHRSLAAAADIPGRHVEIDAQDHGAAGDQDPPARAKASTAPSGDSPGLADGIPGRHIKTGTHRGRAAGDQDPPAANQLPAPKEAALLADPLLALAADVLDDLEKVRIANENRLRQLTRTGLDADGLERGFGLDESHPDVARLAALVAMLAEAEHKAALNLQRVMRGHPLGPWVKATTGIGEKQGARLIAAIGDPWWNTLHDRPRTVSELWAYCGYHVIFPADHQRSAIQGSGVGGERDGSDPGQVIRGNHSSTAGVAPKRQRGQRANWSATAKMRAFLAAESCMKQRGSPYRAVYDAARAKYAEAVHDGECTRCGPRNAPARPGSPLSEGHKHARALRAVAKEILRDLWREARAFHAAS